MNRDGTKTYNLRHPSGLWRNYHITPMPHTAILVFSGTEDPHGNNNIREISLDAARQLYANAEQAGFTVTVSRTRKFIRDQFPGL